MGRLADDHSDFGSLQLQAAVDERKQMKASRSHQSFSAMCTGQISPNLPPKPSSARSTGTNTQASRRRCA
jgi:hypothetical protein